MAEDSLSSLLPHLKLPVAVSCYWLKKAQPHPEPELLKALLLGISIGDMLRAGTSKDTQIIYETRPEHLTEVQTDQTRAAAFCNEMLTLSAD